MGWSLLLRFIWRLLLEVGTGLTSLKGVLAKSDAAASSSILGFGSREIWT
jgi:hypothetical protein